MNVLSLNNHNLPNLMSLQACILYGPMKIANLSQITVDLLTGD